MPIKVWQYYDNAPAISQTVLLQTAGIFDSSFWRLFAIILSLVVKINHCSSVKQQLNEFITFTQTVQPNTGLPHSG
jgi:hypothetical protein